MSPLQMRAKQVLLEANFTQQEVLDVLNGPNRHAFRERELRDEFAGRAMQAHAGLTPDDAAAYAYQYADAMMRARNA